MILRLLYDYPLLCWVMLNKAYLNKSFLKSLRPAFPNFFYNGQVLEFKIFRDSPLGLFQGPNQSIIMKPDIFCVLDNSSHTLTNAELKLSLQDDYFVELKVYFLKLFP